MRCLSCGCSKDLHTRADGACVACGCPAFVEKWPAEPAQQTAKPAASTKSAPIVPSEKD